MVSLGGTYFWRCVYIKRGGNAYYDILLNRAGLHDYLSSMLAFIGDMTVLWNGWVISRDDLSYHSFMQPGPGKQIKRKQNQTSIN